MSLPHNSNLSSLKLYNPQLIHKMCRGDEEKIAKMMEVFIDQTSEAMQEIRDSYSEKDFLRIAKLVHKIKPTLTYFGTAALEKEFYYLEDLILNKSPVKQNLTGLFILNFPHFNMRNIVF